MTINVFAKSITTFEKFQDAVRTSGHALTEAEAHEAATRFTVPLADVMKLRDDVIAQAGAAIDAVGAQTKGMRDQAGAGAPAGSKKVRGLGGAAEARFQKPLHAVPSYVDTASTKVLWGVHLGDDKSSSATAILEDKNKAQIHLSVPVKGDGANEPTIGFMKSGATGTVPMNAISPQLAQTLLPLLDAALANSPPPSAHGSGPQYGAAVVESLRDTCTAILLGAGAPSQAEDMERFRAATTAFDKGDHAEGERTLTSIARRSAFPEVRASAHYVLGEMQHRLGKNDEALASMRLALPGLGAGPGRVVGLVTMAKIHNARREFDTGEALAQRAVDEGKALADKGVAVDLTGAHFTLGVAQKNLGKIHEAVASMEAALAASPGATFIQLALAGYLGMAGKKDEAAAMFASIPVPPQTELAFLDYNTNATWFHAVNKDKAQVMRFAEKALEVARGFHFPGTANYFKSETDLDWLRGDADFQKLLARYAGG